MLAAGTALGPYKILAPLGAGGMGEVYRAHDTRLGRDVAIKVLPSHLAATPEVRARFEREARTISQLSHPHICTLYDVGHQDGIDYLVMELLEGETLAHRLEKGPLPVAEVLTLGKQIAEALDRAHRAGVVHRDLKPGNVMLTKGGAKLMDFGLARSSVLGPAAGAPTQSPTVTRPLTAEGTILGTIQYMSPEQLEGKETDARCDIWALGCVLYEMATGARAFAGDSQASLIAAIMSSQPTPASELQPMMPAFLDRIVRTCLAKDAEERWQSARDLVTALTLIAEGGTGATPQVTVRKRHGPPWRLVSMAAAALILVAFAGVWVGPRLFRQPVPAPPLVRFTMLPPANGSLCDCQMAVSPNGQQIAFPASLPGRPIRIWVRKLDEFAARELDRTDNAVSPFWSADGASIGFFADGKLKRIPAADGPALEICDALGADLVGGTWNLEGVILFSTGPPGGVQRVPASGGTPTTVTRPDTAKGERGHCRPRFLPDGQHFLYSAARLGSPSHTVFVGSLDSPDRRQLLNVDYEVTYSPDGYLVFFQQKVLMARPFDASTLELRGDAVPINEHVDAGGYFDLAGRTLVYMFSSKRSRLTWFDRRGALLGTVSEVDTWNQPALAPDDRRFAVERVDPGTGIGDIWVFDGGRATRLTSGDSRSSDQVWSPDGSRILFSRGQGRKLFELAADATRSERLVRDFGPHFNKVFPTDWSRDGRLAYAGYGPEGTVATWLLESDGSGNPVLVTSSKGNRHQARISPDGAWIAYASDETGKPQIVVQGLSPDTGRTTVSTSGGAQPMWRRDGKELFYVALDNDLMAVPIRATKTIETGTPERLFRLPIVGSLFSEVRNHYAVTSDGQRFLVNVAEPGETDLYRIVLNWTSSMKKN